MRYRFFAGNTALGVRRDLQESRQDTQFFAGSVRNVEEACPLGFPPQRS
jgi:hypothetical protein